MADALAAARRRSGVLTSEQSALTEIHSQAENRLAARRVQRVEARRLKLAELERQQQQQELEQDNIYDSRHHDDVAAKIKGQLSDLEERYHRVMLTNASLENAKTTLKYQVDLLKDELKEAEESLTETERENRRWQHEVRVRDHELRELKRQLEIARHQIEQRDVLILEHNLIMVSADVDVSETLAEDVKTKLSSAVLLATDVNNQLNQLAGAGISEKIAALFAERDSAADELRRVTNELNSARTELQESEHNREHLKKMARAVPDEEDNSRYEQQREDTDKVERHAADSKILLKQRESEVVSSQAQILRLDAALKRQKEAVDKAEESEANIKADKRKLLREITQLKSSNEELETKKNLLENRLQRYMNRTLNT